MEPVTGGEHAGDVIMHFYGGNDSGSSILYQPALPSLSLIVKAALAGTNRLVIDLVNDRVTNVIKPSLNLLFTVTHCLKKVYILVLIEPKPEQRTAAGNLPAPGNKRTPADWPTWKTTRKFSRVSTSLYYPAETFLLSSRKISWWRCFERWWKSIRKGTICNIPQLSKKDLLIRFKIPLLDIFHSNVSSLSCWTDIRLPRHPVSWEPLRCGAADRHGPTPESNLGWHTADHPAGRDDPSAASFPTGINSVASYVRTFIS